MILFARGLVYESSLLLSKYFSGDEEMRNRTTEQLRPKIEGLGRMLDPDSGSSQAPGRNHSRHLLAVEVRKRGMDA
jgi:hypothetical protein